MPTPRNVYSTLCNAASGLFVSPDFVRATLFRDAEDCTAHGEGRPDLFLSFPLYIRDMPAFLGYDLQIRQGVKRVALNVGGAVAANWIRSLYAPEIQKMYNTVDQMEHLLDEEPMNDEEADKIGRMENFEERMVSSRRQRSRLF
jgi:hypothetical protein